MILMKNLILILIFAAVSLNTMASNPVHVIITAGQSNTDGRTPNEDLPAYIKALATDTLTYTEGAYRYCQIAQNDGKGEFIPFWPRAKRSGKNNMWAFDAVTYYWLEQLLQEKFYVVKWAVGGTSIAPDYNASKGQRLLAYQCAEDGGEFMVERLVVWVFTTIFSLCFQYEVAECSGLCQRQHPT